VPTLSRFSDATALQLGLVGKSVVKKGAAVCEQQRTVRFVQHKICNFEPHQARDVAGRVNPLSIELYDMHMRRNPINKETLTNPCAERA
jgi:hypothetical protein